MPLIDYADVEQVDDDTREVLDGIRNPAGEVPAFTRLVARSPHVLRTIVPQFAGLMYGLAEWYPDWDIPWTDRRTAASP